MRILQAENERLVEHRRALEEPPDPHDHPPTFNDSRILNLLSNSGPDSCNGNGQHRPRPPPDRNKCLDRGPPIEIHFIFSSARGPKSVPSPSCIQEMAIVPYIGRISPYAQGHFKDFAGRVQKSPNPRVFRRASRRITQGFLNHAHHLRSDAPSIMHQCNYTRSMTEGYLGGGDGSARDP